MAINVLARTNPLKPKLGSEFELVVFAQYQGEASRCLSGNYVKLIQVFIEGSLVAEVEFGPSIIANPRVSLFLKATKPAQLRVKVVDSMGDSGEAQLKLEVQ